jgi:UDP-2-acetamido-3-amino-2,3-dideoxy-glucuronate N-acetyltransferase
MSEFGHRLNFDTNNEATCEESGEKYRIESNTVNKIGE